MRPLGLLWRGPLDSCNYACDYCPFAKRPPLASVMAADRAALARFVGWVEGATPWALEILLTPYGEALIQPWYREALVRLSHLAHVRSVAIQSNGSAPMDFLDRCDRGRVALWLSWHPSEVTRDAFVAKVSVLHAAGTRLSVGAVAVPDTIAEVEAMRAALPGEVPMWINARKPGVRYGASARARWRAIDPDFELDARPHASLGRACRTGDEVISVDGDGDIRRCHFVGEVLGNLYRDELAPLLTPRPCPRVRCDCWIGYVHLSHLGVRDAYRPGDLLARIRRADG